MNSFLVVSRRLVVLALLGWWLGGLTLYAGHVLPITQRVRQGSRDQGFVTREVTSTVNRLAAVSLGLLGLNVGFEWRRAGRGRGPLVASWALAAACTVWLFVLHGRVDALLDVAARQVSGDQAVFRRAHELYLIATTVQWCAALAHAVVLFAVWRRADVEEGKQAGGR